MFPCEVCEEKIAQSEYNHNSGSNKRLKISKVSDGTFNK